MSDVPPNISEFNTIAGLIFLQLYKAFPLPEDIDREGIAEAMGVTRTDWPQHVLPSGRSLNDVVANTIGWLNNEEYTRAYGAHPASRVVLTTKGLVALNATPSGPGRPVGAELKKAAASGGSQDLTRIGSLIGGMFGGLYQTLGGG